MFSEDFFSVASSSSLVTVSSESVRARFSITKAMEPKWTLLPFVDSAPVIYNDKGHGLSSIINQIDYSVVSNAPFVFNLL